MHRPITLAAALLCLMGTSTAGTGLLSMDRTISLSLQGNNSRPFMDYTMETVTLASPIVEFTLAYHLLRQRKNVNGVNTLRLATSSLLATYAARGILKYIVHRQRLPRDYRPRLWNTRITPSFPSGHVATSAAVATLVSTYYPELTVPAAAYTLVSAYSQLYVGNHYLTDVVGGVLLGVLMVKLAMKYQKTAPEPAARSLAAPRPVLTLSIPLPFSKRI